MPCLVFYLFALTFKYPGQLSGRMSHVLHLSGCIFMIRLGAGIWRQACLTFVEWGRWPSPSETCLLLAAPPTDPRAAGSEAVAAAGPGTGPGDTCFLVN